MQGSPLVRPFGVFIERAQVNVLGLVPSIAKAWRASDCMKVLHCILTHFCHAYQLKAFLFSRSWMPGVHPLSVVCLVIVSHSTAHRLTLSAIRSG